MSFTDELKRRRVPRVALVYVASAFAAIQAADVIFPRIPLPEWTVALVVWLALLGFPVALVLAWAFDVSGGVIRRTAEQDATSSASDDVVTARSAAQPTPWLGRRTLIVAGVFVLLGAGMSAGWFLRPDFTTAGAADGVSPLLSRIAVLPFRNASPGDSQSAMLALGVHDDLLTRLSRVRSLRVTSRTSVMEYASTDRNIRDIAAALGVGVILEGGVQRAGGSVRINVQLIDAATDEHLWAEQYDRAWSLDNLFAIQTDIAEHVALALQATLAPDERAAIAARPTRDTTAFRLYTQARELLANTADPTPEALRTMVQLLNEAVSRDTAFAGAWAELGSVHAALYFTRGDDTPQRLALADRATRRALEIDSLLPDAHAIRAQYYYHGFLDYEQALRHLERALELDPSSAVALQWMAAVRRRQGRMDEATRLYERVIELSPRAPFPLAELAFTHLVSRRYDEGRALMARVAELLPGSAEPRFYLAAVDLFASGDTAAARRQLDRVRQDQGIETPGADAWLDILARDYTRALEREQRSDGEFSADNQFSLIPRDLSLAGLHRLAGQHESALALYRRAADRLARHVAAQPDDERAWGSLGLAYAGMGRREDALRAGRRAMELMPIETEAWRGAARVMDMAQTHVILGDADEAITLLEELMRRPAGLTVSKAMLRLDPFWDPLRGHPRFRALVR